MKYFNIKELVSKEVYEKHGENSLAFLDEKALVMVDNVREILDTPLICNNWAKGGKRNQSGYREPESITGASMSQHKLGKAFDLISTKVAAKDLRAKLEENEDKLIHPIRVEKWDDNGEISWLHVDIKPFTKGNSPKGKIYFFKA